MWTTRWGQINFPGWAMSRHATDYYRRFHVTEPQDVQANWTLERSMTDQVATHYTGLGWLANVIANSRRKEP